MVIRFEKTMISTKYDGNRFPIIVLASDEILVQHIILYILRCRSIVVRKENHSIQSTEERCVWEEKSIPWLTIRTSGYTSAIPNYTELMDSFIDKKRYRKSYTLQPLSPFFHCFCLCHFVFFGVSHDDFFFIIAVLSLNSFYLVTDYSASLDHSWTPCLWQDRSVRRVGPWIR